MIPTQAINDLELWNEGWTYDRTHQEEEKRRLSAWMDGILGITEKYDTWSSSP